MGDKFQESDGLEPEFQTAFPNNAETDEEFDQRMVEEAKVPEELLCQYGCGKPGQFFGAGPRGGELPRCTKRISECPVMAKAATRAAKRAGRLGRLTR